MIKRLPEKIRKALADTTPVEYHDGTRVWEATVWIKEDVFWKKLPADKSGTGRGTSGVGGHVTAVLQPHVSYVGRIQKRGRWNTVLVTFWVTDTRLPAHNDPDNEYTLN